MLWWYWIVLGLSLAAIELATPGGFFVIFFGIAALVIGALTLLGVLVTPWLQWLLFPIIAVVGLRLFRQPLLGRLGMRESPDDVDTLIGEIAMPVSTLQPGEHGRAELRGSTWNAQNVGTTALTAGQRCRVVAVRGLMLELRQES
jgi:membrane protein implicated in regulation of membrane protease activity